METRAGLVEAFGTRVVLSLSCSRGKQSRPAHFVERTLARKIIPWHFNFDNGFRVESSSAIKQGYEY